MASRAPGDPLEGLVKVEPVSERRLYLLRHAKSSWKDKGLADHDRPLARRGRRAAKAIGRHIREQGIDPELVLCSTARRARETLEGIEPALGRGGVRVESELYGAPPSALLARLKEIPAAVRSVMVIGHNPGLEELALLLARRGACLRELEAKFPTGALATLAFRSPDWTSLDRGTAELIEFIRPRDLDTPGNRPTSGR
jgi:phosphohistidine phosphatase